MSILTLATLLASFARQSTAITRPKTTPQVGPKLALKLRRCGGLRGGGCAAAAPLKCDVAIYGGAGLLLIDGAIEYVYPELALTDAKDSDGLVACRHDGLWRAALATLLLADPETAHARAHFINAVATLANAPGTEAFGVTKKPLVIWAAVSAALGVAALAGAVPKWVATLLYVANGLSYYVDPDYLIRLYFPDKAVPKSRVGFWATRNTGATFLVAAVYLAALPALDRADAFGLAMGALAATTVRFVLADPKALGFKNIQPVAVAAFPAALAAAALA